MDKLHKLLVVASKIVAAQQTVPAVGGCVLHAAAAAAREERLLVGIAATVDKIVGRVATCRAGGGRSRSWHSNPWVATSNHRGSALAPHRNIHQTKVERDRTGHASISWRAALGRDIQLFLNERTVPFPTRASLGFLFSAVSEFSASPLRATAHTAVLLTSLAIPARLLLRQASWIAGVRTRVSFNQSLPRGRRHGRAPTSWGARN